jgi:mannose-1-phosphate guanylyltransferase
MFKAYAVIMAGGVGSRFWPKSRARRPKQFLNILSSKSLIQMTLDRLKKFIPEEDTLIISNKIQMAELVKTLPNFPIENIILEPISRNTAPCIGLAALFVRRKQKDGVMVVLPSDHLIENTEEFIKTLKLGVEAAYQTRGLITMGIQPTYPATGYGYIQYIDKVIQVGSLNSGQGVFKVKTFAEKPNLETAMRFLESGDFLWNSGMFIWRADVILEEIKRYLPDIYEELVRIDESIGTDNFKTTLERSYARMKSISIDYGVMEKTEKAYVIKASFDWSDVGSWEEVYNLAQKDSNGNCINSPSENVVAINTKNCLIETDGKLVATVGLDNLIIVVTDDAVLVCRKDMSQNVKLIVDYLKRKNLDKYL